MTAKGKGLFFGWFIVAISFVTLAIVYGIRFSFSVFYIAILGEFGWSRASTAGIFSANVIVYGLAAPIAGILIDRFGPRKVLPAAAILLALGTVACSRANAIWHFYLLIGGVMAISICLLGIVPLTTILSNWFVARRGTAFAITMAGMSASNLVSLLTQYLISTVGWRQSYVILSLLVVVIVLPLVALLRHRPQDMGLLPDGATEVPAQGRSTGETGLDRVVDKKWTSTEWTLSKALTTYRFWAVFGGYLCFIGLGLHLMLVHQVAFMVNVGFSAIFAASIFGLHGIVGILGNLLSFISDRIGRESTFTLGSLSAMLGMLLLLLVRDASSPWMLFLYAIFLGIGMGLCGPTLTAIAADLFQGKNFGAINGCIILGYAIGGSISPWLGGYIFDTLETYTPAFIMVIMALVAACFLIWLSSPRKIRLVPGKRPKELQK